MVKPLIIRNKDIAVILECSAATAGRKMNLLKDSLNKKPHQIVTLTEFCNYFDIQINDVLLKLNAR